MIDTIMAIFVLFLVGILIVILISLLIDLLGLLNIFKGIKIKFSKRGCIDFIKAIYNMETKCK